jgi:hypothetical protein
MFTIDPNITDLKIKEKDMEKVFFSMNNHQVATPEMMLEEARSYIMFFREAKGKLSSYIGLHLLLTDRKLFYAHSSNPFPEAEMDSIEEEALCFVEGLGAMLDEVNFKKMSSQDKNLWIDEQKIFTPRQVPERTPEEQQGEALPQGASPEQQAPPASSLITETAPPAQQASQPQESPVQTCRRLHSLSRFLRSATTHAGDAAGSTGPQRHLLMHPDAVCTADASSASSSRHGSGSSAQQAPRPGRNLRAIHAQAPQPQQVLPTSYHPCRSRLRKGECGPDGAFCPQGRR